MVRVTLLFLVLFGGLQPIAAQTPPPPGPAFGFVRPGIEANRVHLGVLPLMRLPGPQGWMDESRLPSGRAVLGVQLSPQVSVHAGGLNLSAPELGMTSGVIGARYATLVGPFRAGPFVDVGFGRLAAFRSQSGSLSVVDADGVLRALEIGSSRTNMVVGGGGGIDGDFPLTQKLALRYSVGYWHFAESGFGVKNVFMGLGLGWGWRDEQWLWRQQADDTEGPVLAVLSPRAQSEDAYDPRHDPLVILASDPSGVRTLAVDGVPVPFSAAPREVDEAWGPGATVWFDLPLDIPPESVRTFRITATDRSGNQSEKAIRVLGLPTDRTPPLIVLNEQELRQRQNPALIDGYVFDESPLASVQVGGIEADLLPAPQIDRPHGQQVTRFIAMVPITMGDNNLTIVARDSAGHEATAEITVTQAIVPRLLVSYPESGAEVTDPTVAFVGSVTHPLPIETVRVNDRPMRIREITDEEAHMATKAAGLRVFLVEGSIELNLGLNELTIFTRDSEGNESVRRTLVLRRLRP